MIKEVLGIQHRVSSIQHQPVKCTHLSIPTMPAEKILCNLRVKRKGMRGNNVLDKKKHITRFLHRG
jgi:hypothetical protein